VTSSSARAIGVLAFASAVYAWVVVGEHGVVWPDEVYQSLEQAHRLVFGFGFLPWEFHVGARSWAFPGLLSVPVGLASIVGVDPVRAPVFAARAVMALVSIGTVALTMRLAEKLRGPEAALAAGLFSAGFPLSTLFATRCMSEIASGPCLVGAALLTLAPTTARRAAFAGMLALAACSFRVQNAIVAAGLFAMLVAQRQAMAARWYAVGAAGGAAAGGLLDTLTWGSPFHSLVANVGFNLSGKADAFGVAPFGFYATALGSSTGAGLFVIAVGWAFALRKHAGLAIIVGAYVLLHSFVPHKELRFLMPVVPLALALAGAGLAEALARYGGRFDTRTANALFAGTIGLAFALMLERTISLKRTHLGYPARGEPSAWHYLEDYNRLLWDAGTHDDVCGLLLVGTQPVRVGGYSYLRRNVPLLGASAVLGPDDPAVNYVIVPSGAPVPPGFARVQSRGEHELLRREGPCEEIPNWMPYFPP
jgi:GPI mannosyltransferase 3